MIKNRIWIAGGFLLWLMAISIAPINYWLYIIKYGKKRKGIDSLSFFSGLVPSPKFLGRYTRKVKVSDIFFVGK